MDLEESKTLNKSTADSPRVMKGKITLMEKEIHDLKKELSLEQEINLKMNAEKETILNQNVNLRAENEK